MKRTTTSLALVLAFATAACNQQPVPAEPVGEAVGTATPEPAGEPPASETVPPATPTPVPTATPTLTAPVLVPEAEKGEKGARNVLLEWARAIELGQWDRAAAQYGNRGVTAAQVKAQFAPYGKITVGFGDGDVEGGAGSLYYEVPLSVSGNGKTGKGSVVVRRVNDVDGASPAQLRWHIDQVELKP